MKYFKIYICIIIIYRFLSIHHYEKDRTKKSPNGYDGKVMSCSIQLSRTDFIHQDQFTISVGKSTNNKQSNDFTHASTSVASHDQGQCAVRFQPKRAAKCVNKGQSHITATEINAIAASTEKKTASKQRSKALCKTNQSNKNVLIEVGQLVLAKQKYSVPWPSKIIAIKTDSVSVFFFGDGRCGPVKKCDLFSICDSRDIMIDCIKRNITDYRKGIIEMERISGVPQNMSITNLV